MSCATSVFSVMFMSFFSYATYHIMINITNFLNPIFFTNCLNMMSFLWQYMGIPFKQRQHITNFSNFDLYNNTIIFTQVFGLNTSILINLFINIGISYLIHYIINYPNLCLPCHQSKPCHPYHFNFHHLSQIQNFWIRLHDLSKSHAKLLHYHVR